MRSYRRARAGLVPPAAMAIDDPGIDTTYAAVLLAEDGDQETVLYTKMPTSGSIPPRSRR